MYTKTQETNTGIYIFFDNTMGEGHILVSCGAPPANLVRIFHRTSPVRVKYNLCMQNSRRLGS